jgi:phosphatidate cytidylyltransferase
MEELGFYYSWIIWAGSWVNDTFAYFTGMAFGKHKMAKVLSPKKTIEGAIGGIVMTTIIATVFGYFLNTLAHIDQPEMPLVFMAAGAISSLLGIIGDLSASAIKRNHNIKDYGKLIPGHGGILDRFDSVIFTAPAVYWSVTLLSQIFH